MANLNLILSMQIMSHGMTMGIAPGFPLAVKIYMWDFISCPASANAISQTSPLDDEFGRGSVTRSEVIFIQEHQISQVGIIGRRQFQSMEENQRFRNLELRTSVIVDAMDIFTRTGRLTIIIVAVVSALLAVLIFYSVWSSKPEHDKADALTTAIDNGDVSKIAQLIAEDKTILNTRNMSAYNKSTIKITRIEASCGILKRHANRNPSDKYRS